MSVHDEVGVVRRRELFRRRLANFVTMADVDPHAAHLEIERVRQVRVIRRIGVAAHGPYGCDHAQLVEDLRTADVAGMEDLVHTREGRVHVRPHEPMGVADETNQQAGH